MQVHVSMLSITESPSESNIETYDQRYSQAGSECTVRNIKCRAVLPDSNVPSKKVGQYINDTGKTQYIYVKFQQENYAYRKFWEILIDCCMLLSSIHGK